MFGEVVNIDEDGDVVAKFGGSYQLQISKVDNVWKVTNGVDGYGHNCRDEFKDAIVTPLYESTPAEDWVKVEDGLPDSSRTVLVCTNMGKVGEMFFSETYHWHALKDKTYPTHWRNLPSPPKK